MLMGLTLMSHICVSCCSHRVYVSWKFIFEKKWEKGSVSL